MRYDAGPPHGVGDYSGVAVDGIPHGKVTNLCVILVELRAMSEWCGRPPLSSYCIVRIAFVRPFPGKCFCISRGGLQGTHCADARKKSVLP